MSQANEPSMTPIPPIPDLRAKDEREAEQFADFLIKLVNDDQCDTIKFNRDIGCRIRDHIEALRRRIAKLTAEVATHQMCKERERDFIRKEQEMQSGAEELIDENTRLKAPVSDEEANDMWEQYALDDVVRRSGFIIALKELIASRATRNPPTGGPTGGPVDDRNT